MENKEKIIKATREIMKKKFSDFKHGRKKSKIDTDEFNLTKDDLSKIALLTKFMSELKPEAFFIIERLTNKKIGNPIELFDLLIEKVGYENILNYVISRMVIEKALNEEK